MILLFVALGSALGGVLRYKVSGWVHAWAGSEMPWGTLAVNVVGSFFIGLSIRLLEHLASSPETRAFVTIGLLGAFTTFSTYSFETVALLRDGEWARAGLYSLGSLLAGLVSVLAGLTAAGYVLHSRG